MSIRWCGTSACSAALGLAVPMSMPRYTSAESTLMISTGWHCAMASAAAVLPAAVGPANAMARGASVRRVAIALHPDPGHCADHHTPETDAHGQRQHRAIHVPAQPAAHGK